MLLQGTDISFLLTGGTNAGKAHTLFGDVNDNGLLVLFINSLYKHLDGQGGDVCMSVVEYRGSGFYDLLTPTTHTLATSKRIDGRVTLQGVSKIQSPTKLVAFQLLR